jgi:hypothetical protein
MTTSLLSQDKKAKLITKCEYIKCNDMSITKTTMAMMMTTKQKSQVCKIGEKHHKKWPERVHGGGSVLLYSMQAEPHTNYGNFWIT